MVSDSDLRKFNEQGQWITMTKESHGYDAISGWKLTSTKLILSHFSNRARQSHRTHRSPL